MSTRPQLFGAVALAVAGVQYLIAEAIAAAGWKSPAYSYRYNFISDLGSPSCGPVLFGREICSPNHAVMNSGFAAQGILFILAAVLLVRMLSGRWRYALLALAVAHGIGVILVALFSESAQALDNGDIVVHGLGAAAAIAAGNLITIVAGFLPATVRLPRWFRTTGILLGLTGFAAFGILQASGGGYMVNGGVPERIAVYTIVIWELLLAAVVLTGIRGRRPARAVRPTAAGTWGRRPA
ncbi:DUF998 domain-containing protein [Streptomyces galilaeus]